MGSAGSYGTLGSGFFGSSGSGGGAGVLLAKAAACTSRGGTITLYNVTVAFNSSGTPVGGVFQVGGSVNAVQLALRRQRILRLRCRPDRRRLLQVPGGSAVAYNSLFQSVPVGVEQWRRLVRTPTRASTPPACNINGGPTATIALVAAARPSGRAESASTASRCSPISAATSRPRGLEHRRLPVRASGRGPDSHARRGQRLGGRLRPDELHVHASPIPAPRASRPRRWPVRS